MYGGQDIQYFRDDQCGKGDGDDADKGLFEHH